MMKATVVLSLSVVGNFSRCIAHRRDSRRRSCAWSVTSVSKNSAIAFIISRGVWFVISVPSLSSTNAPMVDTINLVVGALCFE
eukprot:IDg3718t1